MVLSLLPFLCSHSNLTLKLHLKNSYLNEGWLFIGRFKVLAQFIYNLPMVYSMHGHISYILDASSKRPNDFSLIGSNPNKILQFKWKRFTVLKLKPKLNFNFMLKGTIKIKTYITIFFSCKQTRNIDIIWQGNPR